jgi:hypothetical protein
MKIGTERSILESIALMAVYMPLQTRRCVQYPHATPSNVRTLLGHVLSLPALPVGFNTMSEVYGDIAASFIFSVCTLRLVCAISVR